MMYKYLLDNLIELLFHAKLTSPVVSNRRLFSIITFHRVLPESLAQEYPLPGLVITPDELYWVLNILKRHYRCDSISNNFKKWGKSNFNRKPLMSLSFDDGQEDNYKYGLPVLEKLGLKATFFVPVANIGTSTLLWHDILSFFVSQNFNSKNIITDYINRYLNINLWTCNSKYEAVKLVVRKAKLLNNHQRLKLVSEIIKHGDSFLPKWAGMMNWKQINCLAIKGNEIGSHSISHPILTKCSDSRLIEEISRSREILQNRLKIPIETFSYPNGDFDNRVIKVTKEAGYSCAVTTKWEANRHRNSMFQLGRCDIISDKVKTRYNGKLSKSWLMWRLSASKRLYDSLAF